MENQFFDTVDRRGTPSLYRSWMETARCCESDRVYLKDACEAFDGAFLCCDNDDAFISPIVNAACHTRKAVWDIGALMLSQLAQSNAKAKLALSELATDSASSIRARALFHLTDLFPREYCLELLLRGVSDKSATVAHIAAWKAIDLNLRELTDVISNRVKTVKKSIIRLELEMITGLMQCGFYEYYNENGYNIVVAFPDLYPNRVVWPDCVAEADIKVVSLAEVRKRIRESGSGVDTLRRRWNWEVSNEPMVSR